MKQSGRMVIWPAALDSTKSRGQGRRLPKSQTVQAPRVEELEIAARKLSLDPEISPSSARPSRWWEKTGHVSVRRGDKPRPKVLRDLAAEIVKLRHEKE